MSPQYFSPGVYVEEVDRGSKPIEGVGTAVAAFVGFAPQGEVNKPTLVTNWTQFVNAFGGFMPGGYLAPAVYGYFANGGTICYVTRLPGSLAKSDGGAVASAVLPGRGATGSLEAVIATALEPGRGEITVEVVGPAEGAPDDQFSLTVRRGDTVESFPGLTLARGKRNAVDVVTKESKLIKLAEKQATGTLAERTPVPGTYTIAAQSTTAVAKAQEISPTVFVGDAAQRSGINGLEIAEDATMVCVPDLMPAMQAGLITAEGARAVQLALIAHCESMKDRVAILDAPASLTPQKVREWRLTEAGYDSKYAALYYPWIKVSNPLGKGEAIAIPPCGHVAGVWARTDSDRGVHKAPANEVVRGALGLDFQVSKNEQDTLNPDGVNCIRAFPGRGVRVWGARTLTSDPAWRYVNVRRLFNFVEKSIERGTQWVVFEPNDEDLWMRIRRDVTAFLTRIWRDGALFGSVAEEAFYVKCDRELNPPETRDVGQVIIEVGLAPVKPAEFVIFRISQFSGVAE
ncbi:MAG: phage tail sheath subtilisin-like domain-containing protein [Chloroflexi bacterium]|nr:phage tail sheath subtilisin-like domain-containing protein [Chloroflexota bacterium]MDA8216227.1 phage tail sheath subtilisin-like domain-containing protein [Dehalococcoidales bacterium]